MMKVISYNVNSLRARIKLVLDLINDELPDVLCLQETKVPDNGFPEREFRNRGYKSVYRGEKSYNGVAILSRRQFQQVLYGFKDGSGSTRLISAETGGLHIVNTYIPHGFNPFSERFREKLDWLENLYHFFNDNYNPSMLLIWTGDFNIAPEPRDVYDPDFLKGYSGFHPDEIMLLDRFRQWGFVDLFREHNRSVGQYSFWDYSIRNAVGKGTGWRIDHIWGTAGIAKRCTNAWIGVNYRLAPRPSDHAPVFAVLNE